MPSEIDIVKFAYSRSFSGMILLSLDPNIGPTVTLIVWLVCQPDIYLDSRSLQFN